MMNYNPMSYPAGVPNPYGPRVHAWKGGPYNEGTRYHGPIYTRPMARFRYAATPLRGDEGGAVMVEQKFAAQMAAGTLVLGVILGVVIGKMV